MGMKFEIDTAGIKKLVRDLEERVSDGIEIPLGGSDAEAIRSVTDQLKNVGITPNDTEIAKMVRDARNG
jgi:hypothetical protein